MTDVKFEEDDTLIATSRPFKDTTPAMIKLLMRWGLAKNREEGIYWLVGIMIFCFGFTFWNFFHKPKSEYNPVPPGYVPPVVEQNL